MSIRRFLGFGLTERLPDHSTFSHAQTCRFADSSVFEQLFTAVLRQCTEAGSVGGRRLLIDATHVEAGAALKSLRAELSAVEDTGDGEGKPVTEEGAGPPPPPRPKLALAAPRTGSTPKRTASNATAVSRSDPDARLRHKPGHRTHLVHRAQVAVDPEGARDRRGAGRDGDRLRSRRARSPGRSGTVRRTRRAGGRRRAGYASQASYATLNRLRATALIAPQPGAKHPAAEAARARMRTPAGRDTAIDRQTHAEGAISELKHHGMKRARCRGTRKTQLQLLAAATAINLKRLLTANNAQTDDQTGDTATSYTAITGLLDLLTRCLDALGQLATAESSTAS